MPSLGHIAVGLAAGRRWAPSGKRRALWWTSWLVFLSLAPDLDFVGVWFFGVPADSIWGHRGVSHSLLASVIGGVLSAGVARRLCLSGGIGAAVGFLVVLTHPLLDCLNVGSLGVPFWWPLSDGNWGFPYQFLPSVISASEYLELRGLPVLLGDVVIFAPLFWYGLAGRAKKRAADAGPPLVDSPAAGTD